MINQVAILFQTLLATLKIALGIGIGVGIHQAVQPNMPTSTTLPNRRPPFGIWPKDFPSSDGNLVTTTAMPDVQISPRRPPFGIGPKDFPSSDGNLVTTTSTPNVQISSPLPPFGRVKRATEPKYDIKIMSMVNISQSRIQNTQPLVVGGMTGRDDTLIDRAQSIIINSIKPDPLFQNTTKELKSEAI